MMVLAMRGELNELQTLLLSDYTYVYFVHYFSNGYNLSLLLYQGKLFQFTSPFKK